MSDASLSRPSEKIPLRSYGSFINGIVACRWIKESAQKFRLEALDIVCLLVVLSNQSTLHWRISWHNIKILYMPSKILLQCNNTHPQSPFYSLQFFAFRILICFNIRPSKLIMTTQLIKSLIKSNSLHHLISCKLHILIYFHIINSFINYNVWIRFIY